MPKIDIALDENKGAHYAKKFPCPACNKKRFVKYFNFTDGVYLDDKYGRCDREEHCGYFEAPYEDLKKDFYDKRAADTQAAIKRKYTPKTDAPKPVKPVSRDILKQTLQHYDTNILAQYLNALLGPTIANEVISRYFIGTGKGGATIFWQIDRFMRARTAQRIVYQPNGKRDRDIFPQRVFKAEDGYSACLFGEHLLYTVGDNLPICLVESEKTAAIASAYLPTYKGQPVIWMATGGVNGLTVDKMQCLENKTVILVPDFSYHARATWGQIPMRKQKNEKGQNIPHPDGELVPDFISYADKLRAIGCTVSFFDPAPDTWDSSDLCDILLTLPAPTQKIKAPNFASLKLPDNAQNTPQSSPIVPNSHELGQIDTTLLQGEASFKIVSNGSERIEVLIEPEYMKNKAEEMLNKPELQKLIKSFDICEGTIDPYNQDEYTNYTGGKDKSE